MKDLMYNVVNGEGTGTSYHLDGYDIIGKTGTAEYVNAGSSSYTKVVILSHLKECILKIILN